MNKYQGNFGKERKEQKREREKEKVEKRLFKKNKTGAELSLIGDGDSNFSNFSNFKGKLFTF